MVKNQWYYAFTLPPQTPTTPTPPRPANTTPNPFVIAPSIPASAHSIAAGKKRPALEDQTDAVKSGFAKKGRIGEPKIQSPQLVIDVQSMRHLLRTMCAIFARSLA